jgi:DNA polymerase III alpha subunit
MIPIFKSHYSIGKSILTLKEKGSSISNGPNSIIDLCLKNKIEDMYLVDDSMSGFLEGYLNAASAKLNFKFGLRISICDDLEEKGEEALSKTSKVVIFANSKKGYEALIKIYTKAAQKGFYYEPRIDYKSLAEFWSEKDLTLMIPFYDSFLHKNALCGSVCVPDFKFTEPVFSVEENDVPFNFLIKNHIEKFAGKNNEIIKTKSIYYNNKEDFKAYLTFRCINNRTSLDKPNLDHMTSDEFCLEAYNGSV